MVDFDDLTEEQQTAANALDRNVTLTAGAGTGKTTTLTTRYMRMLERGIENDAPADLKAPLLPEEIVTTTFTERAANELEKSVRDAITEEVDGADPETYETWRRVADGLEEGYIHTLHGFCSRLLREHALSIESIDPGFDTLDESETTALLEDTVASLIETHDDHDAVQTLARRYSRRALQDIVTDLLTERPGGIEWAQRWSTATAEEYVEFVERELHPISPEFAAERFGDPAFVSAVETLHSLVESPPPAVDTGGRTWTRAEGILHYLDGGGLGEDDPTRTTRDRFVSLCDHLTTDQGEEYSSYTGAKTRWSGAEEAKAEFDHAMSTIVKILDPATHRVPAPIDHDANSFHFVQALARLTELAHEAYVERKREQNVVDFTDQIEFTLDFLTERASPEQLTALREQVAYLMVDEFQDTDPRQWEIVAHLTAEDPSEYDARNVFVVGDVKQSIYRFRNADVTQFRDTAAELTAANPPSGDSVSTDTQLSTNFRSLPPILEFTNALFDRIFVEDGASYEAEPQKLEPFRGDPDDLAAVEYIAIPTTAEYRTNRFPNGHPLATAQPEHDSELEGMAIAARLSQLFDESAQVYDEDSDLDDPDARDLVPDDVAILLRSRTHLKKYERALEEADIPFTVASGLGFYETPEVTALLNLFRALADPGNERAVYGVLRSPLFGFTDDTIAVLKQDGDSLWDALSESDVPELQETYELLQEWRCQLGSAPASTPDLEGSWAAFLTRVIDETGYLATVGADERPQQAVANVEKFRERLRSYSDDGVTSLPTLIRRIERHRELSDREGEATIQGGGEGVKILTVHDAKGMEFPVVVVPKVSHQFNMQAAVGNGRVEFEEIGGEYVAGLRAPNPEDPFEMETTVAREVLKERRKAEERAEEKRVLYVACTRARDKLFLTGTHEVDGDADLSLTGIDEAEPDEAGCWRDWLQPQLLTEETLTSLDSQRQVTAELDTSTFTVSLPPEPADWTEVGDAPTVDSNLSPTPPRPPREFRITATDLASLFDGNGCLRLDERTNTVFFEREEEDEPRGSSRGAKASELSSTTFGDVVHRLCELRPPRSEWENVIERVAAAGGVEGPVQSADHARIVTHAERAMEYLDELHSRLDAEQLYDELRVTAEFNDGRVSGHVDHLVVTPDAYHIVDYKTNNIDSDEIEAKAAYYETQMAAYAIALHQQDPERSISATLFFTSPNQPHCFTWSPSEGRTLAAEVYAAIQGEIDAAEM